MNKKKKGRRRKGLLRPLSEFFSNNPLRRTESGRLCYHSRSDLFGVDDSDNETDRNGFLILDFDHYWLWLIITFNHLRNLKYFTQSESQETKLNHSFNPSTPIPMSSVNRSQSCLSLVLREGNSAGLSSGADSEVPTGSKSRPESFASLPNEGPIPPGRSIGSSRGSWPELETRFVF